MDDRELYKNAIDVITSLQTENNTLNEKMAHMEESIKLAHKLYRQGLLPAEQVFDKIAEFIDASDQELTVLEKAAEFHSPTSTFGSFKLSKERSSDFNGNAEDVFFHGLSI